MPKSRCRPAQADLGDGYHKPAASLRTWDRLSAIDVTDCCLFLAKRPCRCAGAFFWAKRLSSRARVPPVADLGPTASARRAPLRPGRAMGD